MNEHQSARMSEIKNGGLDQYGAGPSEQQQFGTSGVKGVKWAVECVRSLLPAAWSVLPVSTAAAVASLRCVFWRVTTSSAGPRVEAAVSLLPSSSSSLPSSSSLARPSPPQGAQWTLATNTAHANQLISWTYTLREHRRPQRRHSGYWEPHEFSFKML